MAISALPKRRNGLLAYSGWDMVPIVLALSHALYLIMWFILFPRLSWWSAIVMGLIYAVSISWNINGIAHNFIHNPYFRSPALNRAFSLLESFCCLFSQVFYDYIHRRHHIGNSDRQDAQGNTIDYLSIYRHGRHDRAENPLRYALLSYFRDNMKEIYRDIKRLHPRNARWGLVEVYGTTALMIAGFLINWRFMIVFLPSYYLGHCLSSLNGYYKHYGGDSETPLAWGVSSYNRIYNIVWFNNGYHAEHHYRPRVHWTKMESLRHQIGAQQRAAGVQVLRWPHALGFLEHNLHERPRLDTTVGARSESPILNRAS